MDNDAISDGETAASRPDPGTGAASPRVQGLAIQISQAVSLLRGGHRGSERHDNDGLLFLGNWHDAHPRRLFHDSILEPVDKVVWAVIRHHADSRGATAFPTYETIAGCANIGSRATVARAIMLLRATRWLSLCAQVRDSAGRYQGNVYSLHDEPVSLADALHLDPDYLNFLKHAQSHAHRRVRRVAERVMRQNSSEEQGADTRPDPSLQTSPRSSITDVPDDESCLDTPIRTQAKSVTHSATSTSRVQNLNRDDRVQNLNMDSDHRVQYLNSVTEIKEKQTDDHQVQNLNSATVCSSSLITTTTAKPQQNLNSAEPGSVDQSLTFPPQLSREEIALAVPYLERVPGGERQAVLDELQGRLASAAAGAKPVHNPIGYLAKLCRAVAEDSFRVTSAGLRTRQARERQIARELMEARSESAPLAIAPPRRDCALAKRLLDIRDRRHDQHEGPSDGEGAATAADIGSGSGEDASS